MIKNRCKNCIWWDSKHEAVQLIPEYKGKSLMGYCRKHKPGSILVNNCYYGIQPVMDSEEFCGEFREEKGEQ